MAVDQERAGLCELIPSEFTGSKPVQDIGWRIITVSSGWVIVGHAVNYGDHLIIDTARCIRRWGTTRGLGQLIAGPTAETQHDWMGRVEVPMRAVIFSLVVDADAWSFAEGAATPGKKRSKA